MVVLVRKLKHAATCGRRFTAGAAWDGTFTQFRPPDSRVAILEWRFSSGDSRVVTGRRFEAPAPLSSNQPPLPTQEPLNSQEDHEQCGHCMRIPQRLGWQRGDSDSTTRG